MSLIHSNDFRTFCIFLEIVLGVSETAMNQTLLCSWCVPFPFQVTCLTISLVNPLFYQIKTNRHFVVISLRKPRYDSYASYRQVNWTTFLKVIPFKIFHILFLGPGTMKTIYKKFLVEFFYHWSRWEAPESV